ncbi:MAG TPA: hypothetical protein VH796_10000 [Nitrososphaeraceae archaeon]
MEWCHSKLSNRKDKKRLLIYAGIALIASGIILMILLYSFVYLYPVSIPHEDNLTKMRELMVIPSNSHGHIKML